MSVTIRSWLQGQHRKNEQFRRDTEAMHLKDTQRLASLSDHELIAKDSSIPSRRHPMEMERRLKVAIEELTAESTRARKSANRIGVALVVLTLVLVALTVILAMKG